MKLTLLMLSAFCLSALSAGQAWASPFLAGVWNVTSTGNEDYTCKIATPGNTLSYIWIVNASQDGAVSVSVQGETSFPKLTGRFNYNSGYLILEGDARGFGSDRTASWFKLFLEKDGTLRGVRRYMTDTQSNTSRSCFADFYVTAKKQ